MLEGSSITILDKWGRVRIPVRFFRIIEEKHGRDVFVTSVDDENVQIYPLAELGKFASRICSRIKEDPKARRLALRINRLGIKTEIDRYGILMIHKFLRDKISLGSKVVVEGMEDHLILKQAS